MDGSDRDTSGDFKLVPSLAVIKGRPVFVESGRYSQIVMNGRPAATEEVARPLISGYGTLHHLDITSFRTGEPDLRTIRELCGMGGELWTDVGASTSDPLIDAIMAGATTCIVSTKMMSSLSEFASAFELTDGLMVQLDMDEGVLSPDPDIRSMGAAAFCREMIDLGIDRLVLDQEGDIDRRADLVRDMNDALKGDVALYAGMEDLSEKEHLARSGAIGGIISCTKVLGGT